MYLKEIVTNGFKSFADKIDIQLEDKITCIVGPNGSGKSNVVDAVRWVLGEQSVKSLRGEGSMSDVIFSGSKSRNPLNVAWVELIFDNHDHYLNIPYIEISIKRRVYRSGENEYFLNNEKCRLKDITNLLLDTGVGKESFNIISQGEVDRILSNSPMDRRVIFEEAAEILKYKRRKEEALKKLDHTHHNLDRVNDIITELELQKAPLEDQSKKAKEYLDAKENLEKHEVALLAYDIENLSREVEKSKTHKDELDKEVLSLSSFFSSNDAINMELRRKLEKYEQELSNLNSQLLEVTEEVEKIKGERNLIKLRENSTTNQEEVTNNLRDLLEKEGILNKNIELGNSQIKIIEEEIMSLDEKLKNLKNSLNQKNEEKNTLQVKYENLDRNIINNKHKIDTLSLEIEQGSNLPISVKSILKNHDLSGIHNTIGNILTINEEYIKALEIAISSSKNFIITEDETSSVKAIEYLKSKHLGRATFFPLNVIKSRYIDDNSYKLLQTNDDFIAVLADIVKYDSKYRNIVYNQLGTTLVTKDLDSANRLAKFISYRYKIVTLDGDIIHVGGSLSGGSSYSLKSMISLRQELKELENLKNTQEDDFSSLKIKIDNINNQYEELNNQYVKVSRDKILEVEKLDSKKEEINLVCQNLDDLEKEIESIKRLKTNSLSQMEEELIKEYHTKNTLKEKLIQDSKNLTKVIEKLKDDIEKRTADDKVKSSHMRSLEKEIKQIEIDITKKDIRLDNMLNILNEEYSITYERAKKEYILDIEVEEARELVKQYREIIKKIGMVNLAAIDEFERVNTRYEFLTKQKEDLLKAEDTLLEIMDEMDEVMKEEFATTFEKIRIEFKQVFKELFGGGTADLKLTNPDDLLSTGVDIVASPPGKKLTTISLLSGGEKTFTAISLLFAILNVKTVPFCIFDEVEAALDEANVSSFGKYLSHYKDKTQFLIITHKKKTMEFADTLYGITMQESGVSKLVSVKLNEKTPSI